MIPLGEVYMHACHRKRSKISMSAVAATTTDVACAQAAVAVARRALRALKGLVKFQAPFRGFLVRNRVAATLYSMQALLRAQLAVRSKRAELAVRYELAVQPEIRHGESTMASEITEVQTVFNQMEQSVEQYRLDTKSFEIQKKQTYEVHHHLEPPSTTTTTSTIDPLHESNDSLVVMWIYSTISPKLVEMIVDVDSTAYGVWKRLKDLFHDNKDARITQLDNEIPAPVYGPLESIHQSRFFQQIKSKADRLADLGSPVQDSSLVTYAINGIRSKYPEAARIIRLRESAPTFDKLRSLMLLEESDLSQPSNGNSLFHNRNV
ncbi:Toll/interleukin-1 receptor domain-containing protein [Tanacetum coccineum]